MGVRDYLVEGVSGTGKTSVRAEPRRREHHLRHVDRVRSPAADRGSAVAFFCGGSRNFPEFVDLFAGVFVPEIDPGTLRRRLDGRPEGEWGGRQAERDLIARLHRTKEDVPREGTVVDATRPLARVVDEILRLTGG
ncbi:hypothetical protein [Nocardiopsis sp. RV163]|uniref:hypothetical protein n=1 Tax=Nocardiopsis sp. RV163 TaxID=1661388 RepID=UPI00064C081F|nr:hypothetical protein [Nocardiopsis sp. RV163]